MQNKNFKEMWKLIFIPVLMLTILLSLSGNLFHAVREYYLVHINPKFYMEKLMPLRKILIFPRFLFGIALLIFSKYKPFEKVFKNTLRTFIIIISILTVLVVFQEHFKLQNIAFYMFYIISSLFTFNIFYIFIWGFINRVSNISNGVKYYLILAFSISFVEGIIANVSSWIIFSPFMQSNATPTWQLIIMTISAVALMIYALIIFDRKWKKLPDNLIFPKKILKGTQDRFCFLNAAYLLAGCLIIKSFLDIIFKSYLKIQFPDPNSYSSFMGKYLMIIGLSIMVVSILWILLWVLIFAKKNWRSVPTYSSLSILLLGLVFLSSTAINKSILWINQGIYTSILVGTQSTLFFPLIQILYLGLPYQKRFSVKIATEMIAFPLMKIAPFLIIQGLIIVFGSVSAITMYLKIMVPIFVVLLVVAGKNLSSIFSKEPYTKY